MAALPCQECGRRPKALPRHRCEVCQLRHEPADVQSQAAAVRLAMIPEALRVRLTKRVRDLAPKGQRFCAGCQTYRDDEDYRGARYTQCWACRSRKQHAAMVRRTYGLEDGGYAALLAMQGGGCAVCGARGRSKRLAVDHDHKTGAVRGLLCKRHNRDALGALHDSLAMVTALWHYLNTPPASGGWLPLGQQPPLAPDTGGGAQRPPEGAGDPLGIVMPSGVRGSVGAGLAGESGDSTGLAVLPIGSQRDPDRPGLWRLYVEPDAPPPF